MNGKNTENEKIVHLGDRDYYLSVSMYNDKLNIHLRQYYRCFPGRLFPTKTGVTLTEKEYFDILKTAEKVRKFIEDIKEPKKTKTRHCKHSSSSDGSDSDDEEEKSPRKKETSKKNEVQP